MRYQRFDQESKVSRRNFNLFLNCLTGLVIFLIILVLSLIIKSVIESKSSTTAPVKQTVSAKQEETFSYYDTGDGSYKKNCINLFKKIRNNPNIHNPPLRAPPHDMIDKFEVNGQMPITNYDYIDNAYKDASGNKTDKIYLISNEELSQIIESNKDYENAGHGSKIIQQQMKLYGHKVKDSDVLVLGSETAWIEMIATDLGAKKIYTLEYTRKKFENPDFEWWHIYDYLDFAIEFNYINHIDFSVSYSTLQHAGLGRYGDALSPDGDLEMMQMMHCMLKPGGVLFLGVPVAVDRKGYIEFNKGRVYGNARLKTLLNGWKILGGKRSDDDFHTLYVLEKM